MTLPLIKVADHDVQFNFDEIAKRLLDTGGRQIKLRFGSGTCNWTASAVSAVASVTHGMGSTPTLAIAAATSGNYDHIFATSAIGATTFSVTGYYAPGTAVTRSGTFYWLAIG